LAIVGKNGVKARNRQIAIIFLIIMLINII